MEFSVEFKGKAYPLRQLFLQDDAKVLKYSKRLSESDNDPVIIAECAVQIVNISTGIDVGDLNALSYNKMTELLLEVTKKMKLKKAAEDPQPSEGEEKKEQAPAQQ